MKLKQFTYTKPDGSKSARALVELVSPTNFVEGIDVTELNLDELAEFTKEYTALREEFRLKEAKLIAHHGLRHNYRRFDPLKMTDTTTEHI